MKLSVKSFTVKGNKAILFILQNWRNEYSMSSILVNQSRCGENTTQRISYSLFNTKINLFCSNENAQTQQNSHALIKTVCHGYSCRSKNCNILRHKCP